MSNGTTNISTTIGPTVSGAPSSMQSTILTAVASAGGTQQYYQSLSVLNNFITYSNDPGAWILSTEEGTGYPVYWAGAYGDTVEKMRAAPMRSYDEVLRPQADNPVYLVLSSAPDTDALTGSTPPVGFQWGNPPQTYYTTGMLTGKFSYNEATLWQVDALLAVTDAVEIATIGKIAWAGFVSPLLTGFWNGVKKGFQYATSCSDIEEVGEAVGAATESAAVDGAEVAAETTVSLAAGVIAFSGIVVLAAIPIVLDILSHPTYQTLNVYNLTEYNIDWTLGYLNEGAMNAAPVLATGSTTYNPLIPAGTNQAPPGVTPSLTYSQAQFSFASTSGLEGLGYVLSFTITDPTSGDTVASAAAMFDVPFSGDNSLYATFDPGSSAQELYDTYQNVNEVTTLTATTTVGDTTFSLAVTFDYLSGEHELPSGQNAYTYNSLAVFTTAPA